MTGDFRLHRSEGKTEVKDTAKLVYPIIEWVIYDWLLQI